MDIFEKQETIEAIKDEIKNLKETIENLKSK